MNVRVDIDGPAYAEACDGFYSANNLVVDAVSALSSSLGGCGGMAGTDTGGEAWAAQYDPAAKQAMQAGCDLTTALATMANLLNTSLVNHDAADGGAMLYGPDPDDGDSKPGHSGIELSTSDPPSAKGGTGDQPGWWHWIASHVEGLLWPDADTGKLRTAGQAWITAGQDIGYDKLDVDTATGMVSDQTSPEVADAVSACKEISGHMADISAAYEQIGKACNDYAKAVDDHRKQTEDELESFIEWTVAIEAGGAIVGILTAGIGEAAAQAAEAGEVANAASKVMRILRNLIEVARTVATTISEALTKIGEVLSKLTKFLNPAIDRALIKLGLKEAEENLPKLAADAKQLQKKYKHAKDFGVEGNYNPANAAKFQKKLEEFIDDPGTTRITGTYHGKPAILSYNPQTGQVVVQDTAGNFVSGWGNLTKGQLQHLQTDGNLGGG